MANKIIEKLKKRFYQKKVLVVGLGLQGGGVGLARFFARLGARVTVTDKKGDKELSLSLEKLKGLAINYVLGRHRVRDFLQADVIFKGPSVPWSLAGIVEAQKKNIPVEMETAFFASLVSRKKIIGVTGTRGKSTTASMIYRVLKKSGFRVFLGGNVPDISTISYLERIKEDDWFILELSSWSLSGFHQKKISPHIAVLTSFYPDHLNFYRSLADYWNDKKAIYLYQKEEDVLIACQGLKKTIKRDQTDLYNSSIDGKKGDKKRIIFYSREDFPGRLFYLRGDHNRENAAAVYQTAKVLGLDLNLAKKVIAGFKGLPCREEIIAEKEKIIFVNDSTSTTPVATEKAIDVFSSSPVILILGGNSKSLPYSRLLKKLAWVEKIVLLAGSFTDEIFPYLRKFYPDKTTRIYQRLNEAIEEAYNLAKREDGKTVVLFSPGATSFSMFKNEFHRGREFNRIVKRLIS